MEYLYRPYLSLTAEQRKLLCFLAYIGQRADKHIITLYVKTEDISREQAKKNLASLADFYANYYYFYEEYQLHPFHVAPLMVYMVREMPQWLSHFSTFYTRMVTPMHKELLSNVKRCLSKEKPSVPRIPITYEYTSKMIPLVSEPVFFSMLCEIPHHSLFDFVVDAAVWQIEHDVADPDNMLGQLAQRGYASMTVSQRHDLQAIVALYDFYKQGRYDASATAFDSLFGKILAGAKALFDADYEQAFNQLSAAIRHYNKDVSSLRKGYFNMPLNNLMLVLAYHFKASDDHKRLAAMLKKDGFRTLTSSKSVVWLAKYLLEGTEPSVSEVRATINTDSMVQPSQLSQYLALMVARFFQLSVVPHQSLPPEPSLWVLRQELLNQPSSLLSRIRHKAKWELLLEELTPKAGHTSADKDEKTLRVAYVINYSSVEVREQSRLKTGEWGSGKKMSWDTFRRGTVFMDDTDRSIASGIAGSYYYEVGVEKVLPYLIGSDRVYTGHYAPLTPVTIVEEKPYLIIERTKTAFSVKSNLGSANLDKTVIYRKDSNTHYTVVTMTTMQRNYYRKLLAIGAFPLEAEEQLRQFLPKVSSVVEVHSDLVEGGTTLEQRNGTGQLCLQVLPSAGTRNFFDVGCYARPLPDGVTLLEPGKGLNPCVAEAENVRYQVTRDMKGERANLQLIRTFLDDNDLLSDSLSEPFADRSPVILPAEGLLLLMEFVSQQPDGFYMEWPKGGQLQLKTTNTSSWNISLKSKNNWFEVEGEIPIDDDTVLTAHQLLQLVADSPRQSFVRLGENEFLRISDQLRKQLQRIESLAVSNRGHLQISPLHATLLGGALDGEVKIKHDKKIDKLQEKIKKSMAQQPATPKQLKAELRDYQTDGFLWMTRMTGWGAGVCLADDMGLGKTVQSIAFFLHTADEGPTLVAAPASVVSNWRRELERFAPSLHVVVLNTVPDRHSAIAEAAKGDVVVTTYGLFVTESEDLLQKQWNTVCLDEAHVIKNRETKTSASVMKLQAKNRLILTGTPVQNHLGELWNLYQFINPGLLGSYDQFSEKYIVPIEQHDNKERSRQLKRLIEPFILRRTKQEVVEELPDKTEITMPVELSDDELAVYEVIRRRAKQLLEDEQGGALSVNTLAEITRLRQAACSAQLAEKSWKGESSKIATLMQLLEEIVGGGNSVLVFSQFTSFLALVREALDHSPIFKKGAEGQASYLYLDGSVPIKKREQLVQDFQHGRCPVFLISLKAGGLGLNLTGANYVIHLDPWWNPAIEQQATDRAYRIGQRQNVTVYHLISQHTIEEKILRLHETKRNLADAMLSGTSESHKLTSKELLQIIG